MTTSSRDPGDAAERAVGVDQVQRVEGAVHQLAAREQVAHRPVAEHQRPARSTREHHDHVPRRRRPARRAATGSDRAEDASDSAGRASTIVEPVQPGEVAREHQPQLGDDHDRRGDRRDRLRGEQQPKGTTSWAKWLPATSTRCSGLGRWWKNQLSGPGIGCVSWW